MLSTAFNKMHPEPIFSLLLLSMKKLFLLTALFCSLILPAGSQNQSRLVYSYELEANGYPVKPQLCSKGIVFTDNYANRLYLYSQGRFSILSEGPGCGRFFEISPNGKILAFKRILPDGRQAPAIINLSDMKESILHPHSALCGQPVFKNDSSLLFTVGTTLYESDTKGMYKKIAVLNAYSNLISLSTNKDQLVYSGKNGYLYAFDLESMSDQKIIDSRGALYPKFISNTLTFNLPGGQLICIDLQTNRRIELDHSSNPVLVPGGNLLVLQRKHARLMQDFSSEIILSDIKNKGEITLSHEKLAGYPSVCGQILLYCLPEQQKIIRAKYDWDEAMLISTDTLFVGDFIKPFATQAEVFMDDSIVFLGESPYVHQVYDTPDFHDGAGSCGPTTAVMALAFYNRLPAWPTEINKLGWHINDYGSYVADKYRFNEMYYDTYTQPYGSDAWGAYSYMWSGSGSPNSTMRNYYINHWFDAGQEWTWQCEWEDTQGEIDQGYVHTICTFMTAAGHILLAKGYVSGQHTLILHDPFGNRNTPGWPSYDGQDVYYDWPGFNNGFQNLDPDGSNGGIAWSITNRTAEPIYNDTLIDDLFYNHGFFIYNEPPSHMKYFRDYNGGFHNHSWWTKTIDSGSDICFVEWESKVPQAGLYEISAFIPDAYANAQNAIYRLNVSGLDTAVVRNQLDFSGSWCSLGSFYLHPDSVNKVRLGDSTGYSGEDLAFDAMRFSRTPGLSFPEFRPDEARIQIFPQPAKDFVFIKFDLANPESTLQLNLFNMNGQLLRSKAEKSGRLFKLDLVGLVQGIYFLQIRVGEEVFYQKVLLE